MSPRDSDAGQPVEENKMKHVLIVTVLAAASFAAAQTTGTATTSAPSTPAQTQAPAPQPQSTPGQAPPAPSASAAPAQGKSMPQAKSQEEFKAYQDAVAKTAPADVEATATAFAAKYPDSELRALIYRKAMYDYQNANNGEKTIAMSKKILALEPNNPEALVTFATITAQSTRETDLDRDERLNEAIKDANHALQTIDTDMIVPANAPPDRIQAYKDSMRAMAYDAIGTVAMVKKDYATAETNLRKATELNAQPDPVTWLRLSVALDQQKKYPQALEAANKAVQYSADAPQANNLAKMERDRLQKLVSTPAPASTPPASTPPTSPQPATPKPPQ
jgi:tetratricopeptide (TPR) repeat protein